MTKQEAIEFLQYWMLDNHLLITVTNESNTLSATTELGQALKIAIDALKNTICDDEPEGRADNMNHNATHCSDYSKNCPEYCYRAMLTKDVYDRQLEFVHVPLSWSHFRGTSECELSEKLTTE